MTFGEKLRLVLVLAGMVFLIAGVATDSRVIVWVAIGLLAAALMVRLYLRKKTDSRSN
jgi:hypothetical protein